MVYVLVMIYKVNTISEINKEHGMRLTLDLRERYFNQTVQVLCNTCCIDIQKCRRHLTFMSADNVTVTRFKV